MDEFVVIIMHGAIVIKCYGPYLCINEAELVIDQYNLVRSSKSLNMEFKIIKLEKFQ